jgi:hypothetical protein
VANKGFNGELIHFGAVRLRVTGSGSLLQYLKSLNDISVSQLETLTMAATTDREPTALAAFISQRGYYQLQTSNINETFNVSKITVFAKPIATGYPQ